MYHIHLVPQKMLGRSAESGSNMAASTTGGYFSDDMGSETSRKYRCSRRQLCWPSPSS